MYIKEILSYFLWPALIIITWFIILLLLPVFEKKLAEKE
jgi:hypothetical protein